MRQVSILIVFFLIYSIFFTKPILANEVTSSSEIAATDTENNQTVIVVIGAGGTLDYRMEFLECADLLKQACLQANVEYISIGNEQASDTNDIDKLREAINNQPKEQVNSALWLIFIGHGTFDGREAKFNLQGPDIKAQELAELLKPIQRPIAIINASSSSAPFMNKLSGSNRVIITATKSGFELNYTRFGTYFANAITDTSSDIDKDGQTSLLEAFLAASRNVEEFYSAAGRLATEHALLDDNGDGLGTSADWYQGIKPVKKAAENNALDGYRANQFCLIPSEIEKKIPVDLRAKRDELEMEVIKLRDSRDMYSEDEYYSKLEQLTLEIAKIYEKFD